MDKCPNQAEQLSKSSREDVVVWRNITDDGHAYYAYFNLSEELQTVKMNSENGKIRDLWAKKDLKESITFTLEPHACRAFRV